MVGRSCQGECRSSGRYGRPPPRTPWSCSDTRGRRILSSRVLKLFWLVLALWSGIEWGDRRPGVRPDHVHEEPGAPVGYPSVLNQARLRAWPCTDTCGQPRQFRSNRSGLQPHSNLRPRRRHRENPDHHRNGSAEPFSVQANRPISLGSEDTEIQLLSTLSRRSWPRTARASRRPSTIRDDRPARRARCQPGRRSRSARTGVSRRRPDDR